MRKLGLLIPLLLLTGCQSSEQQATADYEHCIKMGPLGSDIYAMCQMNQDQIHESRKMRQSLALSSFGNNMMTAAQPAPRTMVNTTCRKQGIYVNCTSY